MSQLPQTEYHHYIPRFLVGRFAINPIPPPKKSKGRRRTRTNDKVVNAVDLTKDRPTIDTVFVSRIFGAQNMYMDDTKFDWHERRHMETKLSRIECDAGRIIARVVDAHKAEKESITLTRLDKDLLRKFLFVMKYRSPMFFRRFNHQTAEEYDSDDRNHFLAYMREKGFRRPLDVWFDNLLKIIDAKMDPAGHWTVDLAKTIYPLDAEWLSSNIRSMHLAFVTPVDCSDEFILTDNAFSIFEGPVSFTVDRFTGEQTMKAYSEFHLLNVISPQLAMILRDNHMPEPLEDMDVEMRKIKKDVLRARASMHTDPRNATSLLHDLPVAKARNSYTTLSKEGLVLANGADGVLRHSDKFHFIFFRIQSRHTQLINSVMLDQARNSSTLVFGSTTGLRKALEFYLDHPTRCKGGHSIKTITDRRDDPMLALFRKLEYVAYTIGSSVKAEYYVDPLMDDDDGLSFNEAVATVLKTAKPIQGNHFVDIAMVVMVEVLQRMQMSIAVIVALEQISIAHGKPTFPERVFISVQQAHPAGFNQYTNALPAVDLHTWIMLWGEWLQGALQQLGPQCRDEVNGMQEMLDRLGPGLTLDLLRDSESDNDACERNTGLSRHGITKAFDTIGRDITTSNTNAIVSTRENPTHGSGFEADQSTKQFGDAPKLSLSTPIKIKQCDFPRSTMHEHVELDGVHLQSSFKFIVAILLGVLLMVVTLQR